MKLEKRKKPAAAGQKAKLRKLEVPAVPKEEEETLPESEDDEKTSEEAETQDSPSRLSDLEEGTSQSESDRDILDDESESEEQTHAYADDASVAGSGSEDESDRQLVAAAAGGDSEDLLTSLPNDREVLREMLERSIELLSKKAGSKSDGFSRKDIIRQFVSVASKYYGYNRELASYFVEMYGPREAFEFFEANENDRPMTLRTNQLKTRRRDLAQVLIARGANVDPLGDWTQVGLVVKDTNIPLGATPEYLAGHYMLQSASSFLPVIALGPLPDEKILDMAAAPGGKSTYVSQLMRNTGVLFANDSNKSRGFALAANLHRLGVRNSIVVNFDGRHLVQHLPKVDRVLLDAPCSGSGVISKDQAVKMRRTPVDFEKLSALQKELLCSAIDIVDAHSKTGGVIVYSTCSVAVEENEAVIDYVLRHRSVKLIDTGISIGAQGFSSYRTYRFNPSLKLTKRFSPHKNNMDGFFVAKLQKYSNEIPEKQQRDRSRVNEACRNTDRV